MKQYKSSSMVLPPAWDLQSSETTVYHNHDVTEIEKTAYSPHMYRYNVTEYTREEYEQEVEPEYAAAMRILLGEV